jgi:DNA-binding NtrC family response regulator
VPPVDLASARLDAGELTALFNFMNDSLAETTPHGLVGLALRILRQLTQATVCGFLSFDAEDSELKVVLPAGAEVNVPLSLRLTQKVRAEGCSAWLSAPESDDESLDSASLEAYSDAVCVPLRRNPAADSTDAESGPGPLGALHAYHSVRRFSEREVRFCEVLASFLAHALQVLRSRRALEADVSRLRERVGLSGDDLVGESPTLRRLRADVGSLAVGTCTVLIQGESGVGKELVALALHRLSPRRKGPLVTVNCAALTPNMSEAELFGHEKGAFTGADRARPGLFQQADEGTIFLDEIGELSPETQARLLRVLENKTVRPLMAPAEIRVDVRILAATNRDLEKEMRAGRFRRDLFFRLGTRLHVPPLRDHAEDVPALAAHFLAKLNLEYRRKVRLSPDAQQKLQDYTWPGNVRQLRTVLETAVAMSPSDVVYPSALRLESEAGPAPESLNLAELEARAIREALARTGGVLVHAAKLLDIHRETLINKMKRYDIERPRTEVAEEEASA